MYNYTKQKIEHLKTIVESEIEPKYVQKELDIIFELLDTMSTTESFSLLQDIFKIAENLSKKMESEKVADSEEDSDVVALDVKVSHYNDATVIRISEYAPPRVMKEVLKEIRRNYKKDLTSIAASDNSFIEIRYNDKEKDIIFEIEHWNLNEKDFVSYMKELIEEI